MWIPRKAKTGGQQPRGVPRNQSMKQEGHVRTVAMGMEKWGQKEEPQKKNWQDVATQMDEDGKRNELENDPVLSPDYEKWLCSQKNK